MSKALGMRLRSDVNPNNQKRLIDVVEKTNEAKLGAFASMCEDVKSSAASYQGDNILFPASGYALILGSCGAFVAGGVHPKLIADVSASAKILMADMGSDPEIHRICREQAIQLASTYVHKLTPAAAEVILETGLKLHTFKKDGENRLSPEEVVLRANCIARGRASLGQAQPTGADIDGEVDGAHLKESIAQHGWARTITISAMMVIDRIPNRQVAYQFLLEELDGARQGNDASQAAARRSGISPEEYIGALNRSRPEVDGPEGPQQLLMELSLQLADDRELMAKFRCDVGRTVQEHFRLDPNMDNFNG